MVCVFGILIDNAKLLSNEDVSICTLNSEVWGLLFYFFSNYSFLPNIWIFAGLQVEKIPLHLCFEVEIERFM